MPRLSPAASANLKIAVARIGVRFLPDLFWYDPSAGWGVAPGRTITVGYKPAHTDQRALFVATSEARVFCLLPSHKRFHLIAPIADGGNMPIFIVEVRDKLGVTARKEYEGFTYRHVLQVVDKELLSFPNIYINDIWMKGAGGRGLFGGAL